MQPRDVRFSPLLAAALIAGCGGGSNTPADAGTVNCQNDSRVFTYAPNLTVKSTVSGMKVALVQSDPAPPARGNDTWTLHVTDAAGKALPGLSLSVKTLMPEHGHGSSTTPQITDKGGGDYTLTLLYLFMPGVWHIWFAPAAAPNDTADFWFCVQG